MTNHSTKRLQRLRHALWAIDNADIIAMQSECNRRLQRTKSQRKARSILAGIKGYV